MSSNREELIERAKIAMAIADGQRPSLMEPHTLEFMYGAQARAALDVFEAAIGKALLEFHGPPARTVTYKNGPGKKYALSDLVQETAKQVAEENSELLSRLEDGPGKKYEPVGVFTRSGTVEPVQPSSLEDDMRDTVRDAFKRKKEDQ